jgi:ribosomal subunit interface protein
MKTQVRSKQTEVDESVRAYVERRLQFALGRHSARILHATMHIVDLNGPRGGEDKSCRIEVRLRPTGNVFVEHTDADLYAAVDRAAERMGRAVSRVVERVRHIKRETLARQPAPHHVTPPEPDEQPGA